jgi:hypothetical protein
MKLIEIIELPRSAWRVLPPNKWQVALTVAGIVVAAMAYALLN